MDASHKLHLDMGHFSSMQRTIYRQLDIIETQMSNKEETSQQDHPPKTVRLYVCVCVFLLDFSILAPTSRKCQTN